MSTRTESAPLAQLAPRDEHNLRLEENVHPPAWENPEPAPRYNLVVVGAGTAGLIAAMGAAALGGRVALVERELMGGDCLNVGCVPSKALIRASRAIAQTRDAGRFGVRLRGPVEVDFAAVMERMRRLRAEISDHDSARRFSDLGVDVFLGEGRFSGPRTVEVGGRTLPFARAVIATGGRPVVPPIPGLAEAGYLTNVTLYSLTALPPRLAVIGAGPIGCEMAQVFRRFGSEVTLVEAADRIMGREDADAAKVVHCALVRDGIRVLTATKVERVEPRERSRVLSLAGASGTSELEADEILVGVGRAPNVEGLGLEAAEVAYDPRAGVRVDDRLRTSNRRIYAAGDVTGVSHFTHTADATARIVLRNALFFGRARVSDLVVPRCTYTDPEVAHTGMTEDQARAAGLDAATIRVDLDEVDRAVLDGETDGFLKVVHERKKGRILGATVVATHAGESISEVTLAIRAGAGLSTVASTIHPYPTQAEALKRAADQYMGARLTPFVARWLRRFFALRR